MEYLTLSGEYTTSFEIQHSVFICHIKGIESYDEGMDYAKEIAKKYSDATHNCYAVVSKDGQQKFSDDGEPQGTAGMPILNVLKKNGLTNVVAVVTRYFGGIKLGAGGLVTSYTKSCADGVDIAKKTAVKKCDLLKITATYSDYKRLSDTVCSFGMVERTDFDSDVTLYCAVPIGNTAVAMEKLNELTAGKLIYENTGRGYKKF